MCSICDIEVQNDPAAFEMPCTCPGWCFYSPGAHHVNCACKAEKHGLENGPYRAEFTPAYREGERSGG